MRVLNWVTKKRWFDAIAFGENGLLVAGGGYQDTIVWDVTTGAERGRFDPTHAAQFHPRSGFLLLPASTGLQIYDIGVNTKHLIADFGQHFGGLTFAPNEDWAVYVPRTGNARGMLTAARGVTEAEQTVLWEAAINDAPDEIGYTMNLACLANGEHFLSAEHVHTPDYQKSHYRIAIRSRADGRLVRKSPDRTLSYGDRVFGSPLSDLVFVLDGVWLRIFRSDDLVAAPRVLRNNGKKHFTAVAFHPSGRFLAATSNDTTVKLYDTTTWEVARTFTWDIGRMRSIAFSPDGTLAAAGSDSGKVVVWDVDL